MGTPMVVTISSTFCTKAAKVDTFNGFSRPCGPDGLGIMVAADTLVRKLAKNIMTEKKTMDHPSRHPPAGRAGLRKGKDIFFMKPVNFIFMIYDIKYTIKYP